MNNILEHYLETKKYENIFTLCMADIKAAFCSLKNAFSERNICLVKNRESLTVCGNAALLSLGVFTGIAFNWMELLWAGIITPAILFFALETGYLKWYHPKVELWDKKAKVYRSDHHPYGDAHFMKEDEKQKYLTMSSDIHKWEGFMCGIDEENRIVTKKPYPGNNNILAAGYAGSAKDVSVVVPNVLNYIQSGRSIMVASTKDDVYALTHHIAIANGYKEYVFDLRDGEFEHSDGINFLKYVNMHVDAATIMSECFMNCTSPGEHKDYWWRGEDALMMALVLYYSSPDIDGSIPDIYALLQKGASAVEAELDMMGEGHPARDQFNAWKNGGEREKAQVVQGLTFRFQSFSEGAVKDILRHDDIRFEDMVDKKCIIYVIVSDSQTSFRALSSMFFSFAYREVQKIARERFDGTLKKRVGFLINEAYSIGPIPNYSEIMTTCRGYGIDLMTIVQDLPQLNLLYPEEAKATILNNCGIKMFIGSDDDETLEYFSNKCGTFTGLVEDKTADGITKGMKETSIELMSTSDLKGMDADYAIVTITGCESPLYLKKPKYYADIPGSTEIFRNSFNGEVKEYHAHPMLKDFKKESVISRYPSWAGETKAKQKKKTANRKMVNPESKESIDELLRKAF